MAKPDNDDEKTIALALPAIEVTTINQQWWQPVGTEGPGWQWRGRLRGEGRGGRQHGGEKCNDDNDKIAAIAVVTATLNATINQQ